MTPQPPDLTWRPCDHDRAENGECPDCGATAPASVHPIPRDRPHEHVPWQVDDVHPELCVICGEPIPEETTK